MLKKKPVTQTEERACKEQRLDLLLYLLQSGEARLPVAAQHEGQSIDVVLQQGAVHPLADDGGDQAVQSVATLCIPVAEVQNTVQGLGFRVLKGFRILEKVTCRKPRTAALNVASHNNPGKFGVIVL